MMLNPNAAPPAPAAQVWDPIVTALRGELEEYGGLMQLFDEQQRKIFAHDAEAVAELVVQVEAQVNSTRERRAIRTRLVRDFAKAHGRDTGSSLRQLRPEFPQEMRPLLGALIEEINRLVQRARQRHRQNQMLLGRLIDLHRQLIPALGARDFTKTYSREGQVAISIASAGPTTYRATG
jgi:hypothetical protein